MANKRGARWEAQQRGDTTYVGGAPCGACGGLLKYTAAAKCVPCARVDNRVRKRAASPETRRRWYERQKTVPLTTRRAWSRKSRLKRVYGLTLDAFNALLRAQQECCAVCYDSFVAVSPVVDHDHETGKVRGLLCARCNHALGHLRDSPEIARRAGLYLKGIRDYK